MSAILQCEHVGARRQGSRELLCDFDLLLAPGDLVVVVGARGAGKTLLAQIAAGMRRPDRGRVRLFGHDTASIAAHEWPTFRRRIGYAEECPMLLESVSLADNVAVSLRLHGARASSARAEADEILRRLGSPQPSLLARPDVTPEERMRAGLARAMVARPTLLVLDTPLRAADGALAAGLAASVSELRGRGAAALITTDDAGEAAVFTDAWMCALEAGGLRASAMPPPIVATPA